MRINGISGVNFYTPVFKAQKPFIIKPDKFEKSEALTYYEKMKNDMGILSEEDIKLMAQNIKKRVPDVSTEDIYYTMGVLSQFSSYRCWDVFNSEFSKKGVYNTFSPYLNMDRKITLADVMSYLMGKNSQNLINDAKNKKIAYLLDSNCLKRLDKETINNQKYYIYIKNFEKGYNFLNQGEDFENFTVNILKKIKDGDLRKNLDNYLNADIMEQIDKLGMEVHTIESPVKVTPKEIAQNLNPIMISYDDFAKVLTSSKKDIGFTLDFMKNMNVFVTPKQLSENLKQMHEKIKVITKNSDNVYYVIPNLYKSFGLINYMYQKINNISDENFTNKSKPIEITDLPKGSYAVVLDDASLSGLSLVRERFNYKNLTLRSNISDIKIILAPIYITGHAKSMISEVLRKEDFLIYNRELPCCDLTMLHKFNLPPIMSYIKENFLTSFVLPYMGPDTNCQDYRGFYEKMLYSPDAQQEL